jgi:hypothetical protein
MRLHLRSPASVLGTEDRDMFEAVLRYREF